MALYDIEVRGHDGQLLDWARNLTRGEALDVLDEMEVDYQDDPVDVNLIKHS